MMLPRLLNDKHFNRDDIMDTDEGIEDASNIDNGHVNMINNPTWLGKAQDHLVQHLEILRSHNFVTRNFIVICFFPPVQSAQRTIL